MTDDPEDGYESEKKRFIERVVPELVKRMVERAVETGVEKLSEGPENLRNFVGDLRLPKEVLGDIYGQIDDTKNGLYRVVAKEIRDVLEQTQFADEIAKVLTKLSFEIRTEIRFVPNDGRGASHSDDDGDDEDDDEEDGADGDADRGEDGRRGSSPPGKGRPRTKAMPRPKVTAKVKVRDRGRLWRRLQRGGK